MMISAETALTVVGILGNIISLMLFLSPMPTFVQIWKKGSVAQFSPAPYLATLLNCMLWIVYALPWVHPHSVLVLTINGTGFLIELTFVFLFILYSDGKKRLKVIVMLLVEIAFVALITVLVMTLAHTFAARSLVVGSISVFFGTLMYAAPLSVMIPNGLGTLFGLAQLVLYATFYKSTQRQIEAKKVKAEMGLADQGVAVVSSNLKSGLASWGASLCVERAQDKLFVELLESAIRQSSRSVRLVLEVRY
ncbi:hypothetical protein NE237_013442 [Protea cynaroides]|uniref:Bidirectional sugar transporter SWEET n=1 Tax=Protea cynaroides TaxID=273540 RepID=A0A9Q0JXV5_9MAGN|nr:hypothetical protein NE237_013442 [Protea cynaroides]